MKKNNLVFGGVMAAILMSVGAANAATTTIATKAYVDGNFAEKSAVTELQTAIEDVTKTGGVIDTVDELKETIGDTTDGLVKDVKDLQTASAGYELLSNKTETFDGLSNEQKAVMFPTVAAVEAAMPTLTQEQLDAIEAAGDIAKLSDDITSATAAIEKLNGDDQTAGSVAKQIADALADVEETYATKDSVPAAQVQSNWNETDTSSKAYIANKPTIPSAAAVEALTTAIGDASEGLVKDVADLQDAIGDGEGGLVKEVADLSIDVDGKADKLTTVATVDGIAIVGSDGQYKVSNKTIADLPIPPVACNTSDHICVLSVTADGYEWIDVTKDPVATGV